MPDGDAEGEISRGGGVTYCYYFRYALTPAINREGVAVTVK